MKLSTRMAAATAAKRSGRRFTSRIKSAKNGRAKLHKRMSHETASHSPSERCRYQTVSSSRLPDQIKRNCENETYVQIMTNASSRLPRSFHSAGVTRSDNGGRFDNSDRTKMTNASPAGSWPVPRMTPKMLEYHSGSSDMTQSTAAKVMPSP